MDYAQFMKLMEPGGNTGKESVQALQDFIREFPYFQTAQALLAQTMHEQQHVRYEKQLKMASAYAGDRKSLYNLIHPRPARLFSDKPVAIDSPFITGTFLTEEAKENVFETGTISAIPPEEHKPEPAVAGDYSFTPHEPVIREELFETEMEPEIDDGPPVADPHEIIRRRLNEILGLRESKKETDTATGTPAINSEPAATEPAAVVCIRPDAEPAFSDQVHDTAQEVSLPEMTAVTKTTEEPPRDIIEKIVTESTKAKDEVDKGELEYALEASILQSIEKLPVVGKKTEETPTPSSGIKKPSSFSDWLKSKAITGFGKVEEVHAYDEDSLKEEEPKRISIENESDGNDKAGQLIDRFIENDPKIIPSKAEFYSPANQAKKSITENEDIVSETLARIYKQQGNLLKARSSYQRLSLLYPEKMAYFAALISEIDTELNNQDNKTI